MNDLTGIITTATYFIFSIALAEKLNEFRGLLRGLICLAFPLAWLVEQYGNQASQSFALCWNLMLTLLQIIVSVTTVVLLVTHGLNEGATGVLLMVPVFLFCFEKMKST